MRRSITSSRLKFALITLTLLIIPLIAISHVASAAEISSTFDTDLDGWTSSPGGTMTFGATGGNPGGFLRHADADNTDMFVSAPAKFLGDRSSFIGGTVSFDGIATDGVTGDYSPYGIVKLRSGGAEVFADLAPANNPAATWSTFSAPLSAPTFGTDPATFAAILGNLTAIEVLTESRIGVVETVGFDNFRLSSPVPEPTIGTLAAISLFIRRRNGTKRALRHLDQRNRMRPAATPSSPRPGIRAGIGVAKFMQIGMSG
jgi:hypothetical protein